MSRRGRGALRETVVPYVCSKREPTTNYMREDYQMKLLRPPLLILGLFLAIPALAQEMPSLSKAEEVEMAKLLEAGVRKFQSGDPSQAIANFDQVAATYEERFRGRKAKFFCARWPVESTHYAVEAIGSDEEVKMLSASWAYAYFNKASVLMGRGSSAVAQVKALVEKAAALAPSNAEFLGGLGFIYQQEKNWPLSLAWYQKAEAAAREYSPRNVAAEELLAALHGKAYALIELKRFDEAEKALRECLAVDKSDANAQKELRYIESVKAKQGGR